MAMRGLEVVVGEEEMRVKRICCRQNGPNPRCRQGASRYYQGRATDWAQQCSDGRRGRTGAILLPLESTFALVKLPSSGVA